jgi:hypothetical protein
MPKRETELQKHTLNLCPGDYAKLQQFYPDIGAAVIIRRVVHKFVEQIEAEGTEADVEIKVEI